jgi:hypothetical protein
MSNLFLLQDIPTHGKYSNWINNLASCNFMTAAERSNTTLSSGVFLTERIIKFVLHALKAQHVFHAYKYSENLTGLNPVSYTTSN